MTKNSTLFYILDNSNNEENAETAGLVLSHMNSDLIGKLNHKPATAPELLVKKVIEKCSKML